MAPYFISTTGSHGNLALCITEMHMISRLCGPEAGEQGSFSRSPLLVIQPIMTLVRKPSSSEQSSLVLSRRPIEAKAPLGKNCEKLNLGHRCRSRSTEMGRNCSDHPAAQSWSWSSGPSALCREGDQAEEQCTDSGRQPLLAMVPDNRILARQLFTKFGSENCLLLTLPCLSLWGRGVPYSWSPVSAAVGWEEGSPWLYRV